MRMILVLLALTSPCLAQNTCFTDPHGTTICSTPGTVIHGGTDRTGTSIYRDDRGNQLDFQTDRFGNASVELPTGEVFNWSQPVPGVKKDPDPESLRSPQNIRLNPLN